MHLATPLPPNFSLQKAVCSYGFFMTAPNLWADPPPARAGGSGVLERPLRLVDDRAALVRIFESDHQLNICIPGVQPLSEADRDCILVQVSRMLRLSEAESSAIAAFHALHPQAREEGFGRLFRSPTLFEDMVKSLLLCNCGWGRTLAMARSLCELQAELKGLPLGCSGGEPEEVNKVVLSPETPEARDVKRKRSSRKGTGVQACKSLKFTGAGADEGHDFSPRDSSNVEVVGKQLDIKEEVTLASQSISSLSTDANHCECVKVATPADSGAAVRPVLGTFPTPEELCRLDVSFLAKRCGLGYRAKRIWKLAKDICDGAVDLQSLENLTPDPLQLDVVRNKLMQLQGFGPFTCANVLMCIGDYGTIPADSETMRHLKQVHGRSNCTVASVSKDVAEVYARFAPYQFLSYWFELFGSYETKFGKLSCMDPCSYGLITGHNMRNKV